MKISTILEGTNCLYSKINKNTLKEFLKKVLYEGFPTINPVTKKRKTFFKYNMYNLALNGKHPKYPGINFIPYKKEDKFGEKIKKKFQENTFKKEFIRFIKLSKERKKLFVQRFIIKFKLKKNRSEKNLYINGKIYNFKKLVGVTGFKIIKYLEKLGGTIPYTEKFEG